MRESVYDERSMALSAAYAEELDPDRIDVTARQLVAQLDFAEAGALLDRVLLADAFGVAAWSIGSEAGEQPTYNELGHLADARLRLAVGRFMPLVA
jgi:hypothetical protein